MGLDYTSLVTIPISYASCSLGSPSDPPPLLDRLDAISTAGFSSIELSFPDILSFASSHLGDEVDLKNYDHLCNVSAKIKKECEKRNLGVMMLQPFSNFEGWPKACGTDMLQVGSTDTPIEKLDRQRIVPDLKELADMLNEHGFRLAYENWCWSTHAPDWLDVWNIVKAVDRPNIGLCLDTFQSAGGEWADPTTASGLRDHVSMNELEKIFKKSLEDLARMIPKDKIYLLQISDAYKVPSPFNTKRDDSGLLPRARWSHDFRPLPYNGGYLPVVDVAKAVLKTGFRGWFSYEVFDGGADGQGKKTDIAAYAQAANKAHTRLLAESAGKKPSE